MDLDLTIIQSIQGVSSSFWDGFFIVMSQLGEEIFYLPFLAVVYWCLDKRLGMKLALAFVLSAAINTTLKAIFLRPRPIGHPKVRSIYTSTAGGWSFPSGHAQGSMVFWRSLYMAQRKMVWAVTGAVIVSLVGLSRVYLGVHWPSDILGGFLTGWLVALVADWIGRTFPTRKLMTAILIFAGLIHIYFFLAPEPGGQITGILAGALVGIVLERRWLKFEPRVTLYKQVIKIALGMFILIGLRVGGEAILPPGEFYDYLHYLLIGLWFTAGAPWVFTRCGL
jgi:membrane-associated phospholipid phosphatase